jgi:hypothetical protein
VFDDVIKKETTIKIRNAVEIDMKTFRLLSILCFISVPENRIKLTYKVNQDYFLSPIINQSKCLQQYKSINKKHQDS